MKRPAQIATMPDLLVTAITAIVIIFLLAIFTGLGTLNVNATIVQPIGDIPTSFKNAFTMASFVQSSFPNQYELDVWCRDPNRLYPQAPPATTLPREIKLERPLLKTATPTQPQFTFFPEDPYAPFEWDRGAVRTCRYLNPNKHEDIIFGPARLPLQIITNQPTICTVEFSPEEVYLGERFSGPLGMPRTPQPIPPSMYFDVGKTKPKNQEIQLGGFQTAHTEIIDISKMYAEIQQTKSGSDPTMANLKIKITCASPTFSAAPLEYTYHPAPMESYVSSCKATSGEKYEDLIKPSEQFTINKVILETATGEVPKTDPITPITESPLTIKLELDREGICVGSLRPAKRDKIALGWQDFPIAFIPEKPKDPNKPTDPKKVAATLDIPTGMMLPSLQKLNSCRTGLTPCPANLMSFLKSWFIYAFAPPIGEFELTLSYNGKRLIHAGNPNNNYATSQSFPIEINPDSDNEDAGLARLVISSNALETSATIGPTCYLGETVCIEKPRLSDTDPYENQILRCEKVTTGSTTTLKPVPENYQCTTPCSKVSVGEECSTCITRGGEAACVKHPK